MEVVSLKNSSGDVIEVKRGPNGEILVRHADLSPVTFGEFATLGAPLAKSGAWEYFAKRGLYTNSEYGKEAVAKLNQIYVLKTQTEELFVSQEDEGLIASAVVQLDSES